MFTRNGKGITAKSIKSICKFQQGYKSPYLFEPYSYITGDYFKFEFLAFNGDNFQIFVDAFFKENAQAVKNTLLNNGASCKVQKLIISKKIKLFLYQRILRSLIQLKKNGGK